MPDSFTCPKCGRTSYNPNDVSEGYCGNCHDWTADRDIYVEVGGQRYRVQSVRVLSDEEGDDFYDHR